MDGGTVQGGGLCDVHWRTTGSFAALDVSLLSDAERDRVGRLNRPADQLRVASAVTLARRVVAAELDQDPRSVVLDRRCATCGADHGRPVTQDPRLSVSWAHAGQVVGVALTRSGGVGLDLEPVGDRAPTQLARESLAPGERATTAADLLRCWVRKESLVKATGDGLVNGLDGVVVSAPADPPRLLAYRGREALRARLVDLRCRDGYVATVAVLTQDPVEVREQWHD